MHRLPSAQSSTTTANNTAPPSLPREAAARDAAAREAAIREVMDREAVMRQATREAEIRESAAREAEIREVLAREAEIREATAREAEIQEATARETAIREATARELARQRRRHAIAQALAQQAPEEDSNHEDHTNARPATPRPTAEGPTTPPNSPSHRRSRQPEQATTPVTPQRRIPFDHDKIQRAVVDARAQPSPRSPGRMNMSFDGPVSPSGHLPFGGEFSLSWSLSQGQGSVGVATSVR